MKHFLRLSRMLLVALVACAALPAAVLAIDPESNTDGFDPAVESYRINEARRMNAIARQLDLTCQLQWMNPYFSGEGPIEQPIGYESKQVGEHRWIYRPIFAGADESRPELPRPEALPAPGDGSPQALPPVEILPSPRPLKSGGGNLRPGPAGAAPEDYLPPKSSRRRSRAF